MAISGSVFKILLVGKSGVRRREEVYFYSVWLPEIVVCPLL